MAEFSTSILAGDFIPLTLQLDDGQAGLFPRAVVIDSNGSGVDNVNLNDDGFGLYTSNSNNPMPADVPWVVAQFTVYIDPLFQNIATNYSIEIERFDRVDPDVFKGEFVQVGQRILAEIIEDEQTTGKIKLNEKIIGIIEEPDNG